MHSFAYFYKFISTLDYHGYHDFAEAMEERLEKRWKSWEQPLLLLSFLLHPEYRLNFFRKDSGINYTCLGKWIKYYYHAWYKAKPRFILSQLEDYREKKYPFDDDTFCNFGDIFKFWKFCSEDKDELGAVACRIFAICISSASVERLFSTMGFFYTKRRSRLKVIF